MEDGFEATFVVELAPEEVWETLARRTVQRESSEPEGERALHYVLPGFPSFTPADLPGASCTPLEIETGRLLRVRKDDHPCAGTEIAVTLEAAETGTRVTIVQSGFGPWLAKLRDTFEAHWRQIVADLRLYLERGITVPGTAWGASLGAETRQTPTGLEVTDVAASGFGQSAGMQPGDLLLTLRGLRVHDTPQLWTILALCEPGAEAEVTWARGRETEQASAKF